MVRAMLAPYLTRKPPLVQSLVVGACCGLFVTPTLRPTTAAEPHCRLASPVRRRWVQVAVIAIVPIVLLAPTALAGVQTLRRTRHVR